MTELSETVLVRLQTLENQLADNQADLQQTRAELERTREELDEAKSRLTVSGKKMQRVIRRFQSGATVALIAVTVCLLTLSRPAALAQAGVTLSSLLARVVVLEQKTAELGQANATLEKNTAALTQIGKPGTNGARLTITGDNVQIVDGSGYTDDGLTEGNPNAHLSGLGNLIIGYNKEGNYYGDVRTGSHNLIVGDQNNYSAYGGIVAGDDDSSLGPYASVTGGLFNRAVGSYSSVTGGDYGTASGGASSISGGDFLTQNTSYGWSGGMYHSP